MARDALVAMTQGAELTRDWLALQRELQNSLEAQKRQAILVEKLQAKVEYIDLFCSNSSV